MDRALKARCMQSEAQRNMASSYRVEGPRVVIVDL